MDPADPVMHPIYMPFTEGQLSNHFNVGNDEDRSARCLVHYKSSVEQYNEFKRTHGSYDCPIKEMLTPCQIERDECIWTASTLMTIFYSQRRIDDICWHLSQAFPNALPLDGLKTWEECLDGPLKLYFEAAVPSPAEYRDWLDQHVDEAQFIPYLAKGKHGENNRERATTVDAILVNEKKGFGAIVEAKVLSDISYMVTRDTRRNQMARNIDIMTGEGAWHLRMNPRRTLFLLLTPRCFKSEPGEPVSRLYAQKYYEYTQNPSSLKADLQHRTGLDWSNVSKRIGWLTWEDFKTQNDDCCKWLPTVKM